MAKETVFIVLTHKHSLKPRTKDQWEVHESVEFVNQLRKRHYTTSSAIGDYTNRKVIVGKRFGITEYSQFENYVRSKYEKQMEELDKAYGNERVPEPVVESQETTFVDEFGNTREKTVFDA